MTFVYISKFFLVMSVSGRLQFAAAHDEEAHASEMKMNKNGYLCLYAIFENGKSVRVSTVLSFECDERETTST